MKFSPNKFSAKFSLKKIAEILRGFQRVFLRATTPKIFVASQAENVVITGFSPRVMISNAPGSITILSHSNKVFLTGRRVGDLNA